MTDVRTERCAKAIQEQVKLSWGKAIKISYHTVRVRIARSLITVAGVVLAITFLMATLTRGAAVQGMNANLAASIKTLKDDTASVELADELKMAVAEGLPLKGVAEHVERGDFKSGAERLQEALAAPPGLAANPRIRKIQSLFSQAQATGDEIKRLERMQRHMDRLSEGGGAARAQVQNVRTRRSWLIAMTLLVAFVGIISSMLMSATERFREIGTMKCLGALDGFIVRLFVMESSIQGFSGAFLGILLGLVVSLAKLHLDYGSAFWRFIPIGDLGLAVLYAMLCGTGLAVLGALYPARVASRMEPVVALRVDQ